MPTELTIITLKCAGCGAALSISEDMTQFACGYCGTEQMVERRGGTVALKPITDAIAKVQVGTDKTAAELALKRLPKELDALVRQRTERGAYWEGKIAVCNSAVNDSVIWALIISFVVIMPIIMVVVINLFPPGTELLGLVLGLSLSSVLVFYLRRRASVRRDDQLPHFTRESRLNLATLDSQIRSVSEKIEENRRIANS